MKKAKRLLFLFLTILILVPIVAVSVSASNYTDQNIYNFTVPYYNYSKLLTPRSKDDTTPLYLYLTEMGYSNYNILVQTIGCTSATDTTSTRNLTVSNGVLAQYVSCREGLQYSIHSDIYEEGYRYASLRFQDRGEASGNTIITGWWSPDSIGTYTSATGPAL